MMCSKYSKISTSAMPVRRHAGELMASDVVSGPYMNDWLIAHKNDTIAQVVPFGNSSRLLVLYYHSVPLTPEKKDA